MRARDRAPAAGQQVVRETGPDRILSTVATSWVCKCV